jgi:hypothetical protein
MIYDIYTYVSYVYTCTRNIPATDGSYIYIYIYIYIISDMGYKTHTWNNFGMHLPFPEQGLAEHLGRHGQIPGVGEPKSMKMLVSMGKPMKNHGKIWDIP